MVVISAGDGGIPVVRRGDGSLIGFEAVIDKDHASALLASSLKAEALLMLTDVAAVFRDFGTDHAAPIAKLAPGQAAALTLPQGSMAPKVAAACDFVQMTKADPFTVQWDAMGFMFFTWFMWPVWIPFCVYALEPNDSRRKPRFLSLALTGLVFGLLLYVPHGLNSSMVVVEINNKSLAYEKSMWLDFMMPRRLSNLIYVFLIIIPPALSHYRHFALTLVAVVVVDFALLQFAYISFFCLLAGLATLHLVYIILTNKCAQECPELFQ